VAEEEDYLGSPLHNASTAIGTTSLTRSCRSMCENTA